VAVLVDPLREYPDTGLPFSHWCHAVSDTSFEELHAFARELGIPERGFDRDHYDVPAEYYDEVLAAGAVPVSSRELVSRLVAAGLRRRKGGTP
jgi:muramoyltetrapeptide carboxypeptidase